MSDNSPNSRNFGKGTKTDDKIITTARSKFEKKIGSGYEIADIRVEPLSHERSLVKNKTEKELLKSMSDDEQLDIPELPGQRLKRMQTIKQQEVEKSLISAETEEKKFVSKTQEAYEK